MKYHSRQPTGILSGYVKTYWMIENLMMPGKSHTQRIVPTGLFELTFHLGDLPVTNEVGKTILRPSVLSGQLNKAYDLTISGNVDLFSIYFFPHTLSLFVDVPIRDITNYLVPIKDLVGSEVDKLEEELSKTRSFQQRVQIANAYLLSLLKAKKTDYQWKRIYRTIELVNAHRGVIDISELADEVCLSRKQFERLFTHYVGLTPKQFLKIARFQNAIDLKSVNPGLSFTEVAYRAGYYDQAHMINDFNVISGYSPSEYFRTGSPYSDYFQ